jgi:putative membrane protein
MKSKSQFSMLRLFLTGFFMGMADLIPGVSGGTVAFISGVYEDLLASIKHMSTHTLKLVVRFKIQEAIASIPFKFLIPLFAGIAAAVVLLAKFLSFMLQTYPVFVWSFFFGLVVASTWLVAKRVKVWNTHKMMMFGVFAVIGYILVGAVPVETPENLPMFFGSGMLAIVAMILPGISGSFILLIIGKYAQVLAAVKDMNIAVLLSVMAGAVVGLGLFSRILSWLFEHKHDISIAALSGFMLGSVRKLWPWKETILTRINSHGEIVPLVEKNMLPAVFDISVMFAIVLMVIGIGIILYVDRLELVKEEN